MKTIIVAICLLMSIVAHAADFEWSDSAGATAPTTDLFLAKARFYYITITGKSGVIGSVGQDCQIEQRPTAGTYIRTELERWAGLCRDIKAVEEADEAVRP